MKIDLNYGVALNKSFVQDWWKEQGKGDPSYAISALSNATMVPCVVIAFWIGELEGWPEDIKKLADMLIKFYGYTQILNKPSGCPW